MADVKEKESIPTVKEEIDSHTGDAHQQSYVLDIDKIKSLQNYTTKELVECLKRRDGVIATIAVPPTDSHSITVNGPAVVMIILD